MSVQDTLNSIEKQVNEDGFNGTLYISCEDYGVIKTVLELQIPKKPLIIKNDKDIKLGYAIWKAGVPIYKCSQCNDFISRSNKFCTDCGQALDWSDEE